jgi:multiple sugar transport system permease protein
LAAVFKVVFRENGPINMVLSNVFSMEALPKWFADSSINKIPIIIFLIWTAIGYELVIYMAALQNIPKSYYEAAEIDGANSFHRFMKITLPLISPTTFYLLIVRFIATFKLFTAVNIMTLGTPARSNTSMVVRIYEDAFNTYKFGYASAEALVLFVIILIITIIQFRGQKKWVHY